MKPRSTSGSKSRMNRSTKMRALVAPIALLLLASCSSPLGDDPLDVSGSFNGPLVSPLGVQAVTLNLTQDGRAVEGSLVSQNITASVEGTLSGNSLEFSLQLGGSCGGNATATADVLEDGDRLRGDFEAVDSCSGAYTGTFDVVRSSFEAK